MSFSKFDPHRPEPDETTVGERKAHLLRWWNWITLGMTLIGFAFIGYWLLAG